MKTAIIVVALMGALASWASDATTTLVETESVRIRFDAVGRPLEWVACLRERSGRPTGSLCRHFLSVVDTDHSGVPAGLLDPGEPVRHWREDGPERMLIGFESVRSSGERLRQTYELTPGTYGVRYAVEVSGVAGSGKQAKPGWMTVKTGLPPSNRSNGPASAVVSGPCWRALLPSPMD
jgi:hypothetical protein